MGKGDMEFSKSLNEVHRQKDFSNQEEFFEEEVQIRNILENLSTERQQEKLRRNCLERQPLEDRVLNIPSWSDIDENEFSDTSSGTIEDRDIYNKDDIEWEDINSKDRDIFKKNERGTFENEAASYVVNNDYYNLNTIRELAGFEIFNLLDHVKTKGMLYYLLSRNVELFKDNRFECKDIEREVNNIKKDCNKIVNLISGNARWYSKFWNGTVRVLLRKSKQDIIDEILNGDEKKSDLFCTMGLNEAGETISSIISEYNKAASVNYNKIKKNVDEALKRKQELENDRGKSYIKRDFLSAIESNDIKNVEEIVEKNPFLLKEPLDQNGLTCLELIRENEWGIEEEIRYLLKDMLIALDNTKEDTLYANKAMEKNSLEIN